MESKNARDPDFTRRQILIAAKREFNSVGYFATDTNKIAKLAGYSPGTFYRHFKDKIAIFIEVYEDWSQEQMSEINRALYLGGPIPELSERLTDIVISFYGNWRQLRASARVLRISEPRVKEYRAARRSQLINNVVALRAHLKLTPISESNIVVFIILLERLGDAVTDGEFDFPSLGQGAGRQALLTFILRFLEGTP